MYWVLSNMVVSSHIWHNSSLVRTDLTHKTGSEIRIGTYN
ncbi:hypothetical protein DFO70_1282 [Cytobacillus firmus]|uniref:Uncharacterized protein n=2 Tax=Cytobacillus TaxID=2675230 RepID=A0A366JHF6_CYTFI|nr:hypothetical protein DFO70_1282 [Cytobacillus firmus]TDX35973.1 hypothetical protein DFO72_1222 [Cytobacillus oceanisediminis]